MKRIALPAALAAAVMALAGPVAFASAEGPAASSAAAKKKTTKKKTTKKKTTKKKTTKAKALLVCRRGCPYSSIQKAVDAAKPGATVRIKPGTYTEGVTVKDTQDKLKIVGLGTKPEEVVLEGKGAKRADGNPAQNGIFVDGADGVEMRNITAQNFPANGFFVRNCDDYVMDHLVAGFNRAYGLYAFNCIGGRMTYSVGYGHGDSAFYIGQTPVQEKPKQSLISHSEAYENVLGYSGTNSKYVTIQQSEFYNNGAGVAPNTLQSEKFPPALDGKVTDNLIYWNNFNYFKADSKVKALPAATGGFNYPMGVGVVLFGTTNWDVRANLVFGNFKWGIMSVSDPTYEPATNKNNKVRYNVMGAAFDDANGTDIWTEGTGSGNCWENNSAGATYDPGSQPEALLYPKCNNPVNNGDVVQIAEVAEYLTQSEGQENSWKKHPHPPRPDRKPIDGQGG
ncbi:right-handed parallel beta-helix repeat-containing protein [Paraconexibacter sp.]|uniref:right-handed parallel beta-helix repeat-containing protein n=1 Tax=Paraconexibacter sp. TaxID=2949640 RepID=UPI003562C64A